MRALTITLTVKPDGTATIELPPEVPPGDHQAVLVIEETLKANATRQVNGFSVDDMGTQLDDRLMQQESLAEEPFTPHTFALINWPAGATFRREDLYGDDGR